MVTLLYPVAFIGDSIEEKAQALIVPTTPIVINNALQTPVIVLAVDFQFRGIVSLSGSAMAMAIFHRIQT